MDKRVDIIGAGLAGSEAALQLAKRGIEVRLFEMRPNYQTDVHKSGNCAELVCSNSLKSMKPESAAGMLKAELTLLGSALLAHAYSTRVPAGGALAVDRTLFSQGITAQIDAESLIERVDGEVVAINSDGSLRVQLACDDEPCTFDAADALIIASGPLTSDMLAQSLQQLTGCEYLAFYDAAAPVVLADSLNLERIFSQSRYEDGGGDYLNAPFDKETYERFINELVAADRVIRKSFETDDLFQACQPIEELARRGFDAPRFGPLKPVGLTDPATGRRPWAVVQLRAEDAYQQSYNLVGFQTNLTFPEQARVFRMIPGLENAEFARYGVMHRNTFIDAPRLLSSALQLRSDFANKVPIPIFIAGQLGGTEGYCEAIASGLVASLSCAAQLRGIDLKSLPELSVFGSLLAYATNPETIDYQPMHVNFGIIEPLPEKIKNKGQRYAAYAQRGHKAMAKYCDYLHELGML